jgi:hypothetical protein
LTFFLIDFSFSFFLHNYLLGFYLILEDPWDQPMSRPGYSKGSRPELIWTPWGPLTPAHVKASYPQGSQGQSWSWLLGDPWSQQAPSPSTLKGQGQGPWGQPGTLKCQGQGPSRPDGYRQGSRPGTLDAWGQGPLRPAGYP